MGSCKHTKILFDKIFFSTRMKNIFSIIYDVFHKNLLILSNYVFSKLEYIEN